MESKFINEQIKNLTASLRGMKIKFEKEEENFDVNCKFFLMILYQVLQYNNEGLFFEAFKAYSEVTTVLESKTEKTIDIETFLFTLSAFINKFQVEAIAILTDFDC